MTPTHTPHATKSSSERAWLGAGVAALFVTAGLSVTASPPEAHADVIRFDVPTQGSLPARARTLVLTLDEGISVMSAPSGGSEVVGRTLPRAQLPALEGRHGPGCRRLWVRVEENAWLCGDHGLLSSQPPAEDRFGAVSERSVLPWDYAFTRVNDTRAYRTLGGAVTRVAPADGYDLWESNWGFAIVEVLNQNGQRVMRSLGGRFFRREDVYRLEASGFAGAPVSELVGTERGVPFGWVGPQESTVFRAPDERERVGPIERLSRVRVYELRNGQGGLHARIGPDRWVRAERLRWVSPEPPPEEVDVSARQRWVDVDVASQTVVAYEGATPVWATLASTGDERHATPPGQFRVWSRHRAYTMDNTEDTGARSHYRMGDVPYVQFFDSDRGFHAVYWHDGFGSPRSHGCVNLSPRDARWLFDFTSHPMPAGWMSRSIPEGQGTLVRVRGRFGDPVS